MTLRLACLLSVLSWLIFAIGVIAPLTPSEGSPGPVELTVFVGCPLILLGSIGVKGAAWDIRAMGGLQFGLAAYIAWRVLSTVLGS